MLISRESVFCQQKSTLQGWDDLCTDNRVSSCLFLPTFLAKKTEINHAVENLDKIWHHMWHRGHKCNCFGDLSVIVAKSQLWEFLKYLDVHYCQACILLYLSAFVDVC